MPLKSMPRPPAPSPNARVTRRQFSRQAVTAGLTAALAVTPLAAQSEPPSTSRKETDSDTETRYQRIIRLYGNRLSDEQRKRLRKILAYNEKLLAPVRAFPLENGQPAATVLKFYADAGGAAVAGQGRSASHPKAKK